MSRQTKESSEDSRAKGTFLRGGESPVQIKTRGDRQGGIERVWRMVESEERVLAKLLVDVFDVTAAFYRALALRVNPGCPDHAGSFGRIHESPT